jgi:UDP-N-acetylglucosamine diphosphorylase / glucose-1-phosphate thymidylyltransferase / UDP-N-acetylgalactosamine diphosphorylase / glucosamine-1-phosphate N-acetyltransferase / galactosamine-1-phosphate N-acetyltransferase
VRPRRDPGISTSESLVVDLMRTLWERPSGDPFAALLPRNPDTLADFYPRLQEFVARTPRSLAGRIDPAAIVRGDIVSMGPGSVIEAGAVIHDSCRLVLGPGSRVRSGAVLRDEVVVGAACLIGVHCEVFRSVILGPNSMLGHFVLLADSILGQDVLVGGNVIFANTAEPKGRTVGLKHHGVKLDSRRSHLGALVGDGVEFGAATMLCPGCIVAPGLVLPPQVVLYGTIDGARRAALMRRFFATWDSDE